MYTVNNAIYRAFRHTFSMQFIRLSLTVFIIATVASPVDARRDTKCATRRTRTRFGDRSFSVAGPCLWNSLPVTLHDRDISLVQFKKLLKTLLFVRAAAHSDCCFFAPCTNILTYLLTYLFTYLQKLLGVYTRRLST